MTTYHTTTTVATRLGIQPSRVRQLAAALQIGQRIGRDWLFSDDDIARLEQRNTKRGRPTHVDELTSIGEAARAIAQIGCSVEECVEALTPARKDEGR